MNRERRNENFNRQKTVGFDYFIISIYIKFIDFLKTQVYTS